MSNMVHVLNDSSFDSTLKNYSGYIVVDFFADWCGPCVKLAPILDEIAKSFKDKNLNIKIYKVNVDESNETSMKFSIKGIPALFIFKNSEIIASRVGGADAFTIENWILDNCK